MRIISIVGLKDTGKTSLTNKIISELTNRDYKVASIKHSHHEMMMDREGTDTWKQMESGSDFVVGIGSRTFFNINESIPLERVLFLVKMMCDPDFLVIEGFKNYHYAKIVTSPELEDDYTIASVNSFEITDIIDTLFVNDCGYNDASVIAKAFVSGDLKYNPDTQADVSLAIDGINIGLNAFVNDFLKETIIGMLKALKTTEYGVEDFNNIEISIKNKNK